MIVASFLGSVHCAAMCGGLVGAVGSAGMPKCWAQQQTMFHAGRGLVYVALGGVAGTLGSAVNLAAGYAGVVDAAGLAAGVLVLGAGLRGLLVARGVSLPAFGTTTGLQRWLGRQLSGVKGRQLLQAGVLGVSTAVLPCGWLYAFVFAAAGTGSTSAGAGVMLAFWLGTLPALLGVGAITRRLASGLGRHVALLSALVLLALGLATILHRVNIPAEALAQIEAATAHAGEPERLPCHGRAAR